MIKLHGFIVISLSQYFLNVEDFLELLIIIIEKTGEDDRDTFFKITDANAKYGFYPKNKCCIWFISCSKKPYIAFQVRIEIELKY